jgi:tRNA/rRNA methyltransferase
MISNIRIVLIGTLYSGNIGSVCRAMANFGLTDLVLVSPVCADGWAEASKFAVHGAAVLEGRRTVATFDEAVSDCVAVVGTTARLGLYRQHVRTPREAAPGLLALAGGGSVALVFGREDKGLLNDEVARCTHLLRIPTGTEYTSINLGQAVLLCAYELFLASDSYAPPCEKAPPAQAAHRLRLLEIWREMLLLIGFMTPEKADHMMQGVQRIFSRGALTTDDVNILMGVARQAGWAARANVKPKL